MFSVLTLRENPLRPVLPKKAVAPREPPADDKSHKGVLNKAG